MAPEAPAAVGSNPASEVGGVADARAKAYASSKTLPVAERFVSINGEGQQAGKLAAFVRFAGCNLRCTYCDTMWANTTQAAAEAEPATCDDIVSWVRETGVRCVTLTGGEPVLQPLLPDLAAALLAEAGPDGEGLRVEVETNGAADLAPLFALREHLGDAANGTLSLTVDWKLPSSGMESHMLASNFAPLDGRDTVKFVCGETADLARMLKVARELGLPGRVSVYLSPAFGSIDAADIVAFMQKHRMTWATLQLQLHKIIWPNTEKGV